MRLVMATTNRHKLREIRGIFGGAPVEVDGLDAFAPVAEPEETGTTFTENGRQKALYYAQQFGVTAVAEDSGLEIDGLGGDPGVYSARYGGEAAPTYPDKFALIYNRLRERQELGCPARFVCALAVAAGPNVIFEARGTIEGCVADAPHGAGGFGYDPIFFIPDRGVTLAELSEAEKAEISHRGRAFRQLRAFLEQRGWQWENRR